MKNIKILLIILTSIAAIVVLAGMYKFNYLAGQDNYDADGNKVQITEVQEGVAQDNALNTPITNLAQDTTTLPKEVSTIATTQAKKDPIITQATTPSPDTRPLQESAPTIVQPTTVSEETIDDNYDDEYAGYIVETEVDGPDECTEFEEYDADFGVCFFECDDEAQCDAIEVQVDAALEALDDEYQEFAKDFTEFEGDASELEEEAEVVYKIASGEQFVIVSGTETSEHKKIKDWLAAISPDNFSDNYLSRLIPYTKVGDDTAAFVTLSDNAPKWDMYVNMDTMSDGEKEMVFTIIHEYAHILTLNSSQMSAGGSCATYLVDEGCTESNAYLNKFYKEFWEGSFDPKAEDSYDNYDQDPSAFVTEYAASNPGEDIAESFASFIFKKKENAQTIAEQKIIFFYDYSELTSIRDSIRSALQPIIRGKVRL